ncbi:hypothetical protein [Vibrio sp. Hal054]|uniref:hypothetical protein n=1 Tax=Vibrio sp. Hal054 TaxID=3035158 RepID=UPI00301CCD15
MKTGEFEQALANDAATSFWFREQVENTKQRDPIDALRDAETLVSVLKERVRLLVGDQAMNSSEHEVRS